MKKEPLILLCNDDGIYSGGLKALEKAIRPLGTLYIVAPDRDQSTVSHSLTLHRPLRIHRRGERGYAVNGTPTDCVNLAINTILPRKPALLISGINKGGNIGDDVTYSGTVSAAMEGTLLGIPSFAISVMGRNDFDFGAATSFARRVARAILENGLPKETLLNVNVPSLPAKRILGYTVTQQGKRVYEEVITEKIDPRGKKYYWIGGDELKYKPDGASDMAAIRKRYISITPIHLDLTDYAFLDELRQWKI
ncbi:MAG: 5'/3'-nucleotidase SurE [Deltaproteobacteria bacterium]|nr:5'/3'-nucleotidase SurE [Deltaproteobacteria bacterium]